MVAVPCTSNTGGDFDVGLPFGQVNEAARSLAATVKGASPSKSKSGINLPEIDEAVERLALGEASV